MGCTRFCHYCRATKTPMWRSGPDEYRSLCNACGLKWMRGKILNERSLKNAVSIKGRTNEFAKLLENLDKHKTKEFVGILSRCFQSKNNLCEVQFNVMDIDSKTWELLRRV